MDNDSKRRINFAVVGGLAAAVLLLVILIAVNSASASITGDAPPLSGHWTINNPTTIIDEPNVWVTDGNITVNARLTIYNSFIIIDNDFGTNDYGFMKINAIGSLLMNESYIYCYRPINYTVNGSNLSTWMIGCS